MKKDKLNQLSKRERQIIDIIHRKKSASVKEVLNEIPDPPSYSSIRALMRIMEEKGYLFHKQENLKYVYYSAFKTKKVVEDEFKRILKTHFNNSMKDAVAALIDVGKNDLSEDDFTKLMDMIEKTKTQGK